MAVPLSARLCIRPLPRLNRSRQSPRRGASTPAHAVRFRSIPGKLPFLAPSVSIPATSSQCSARDGLVGRCALGFPDLSAADFGRVELLDLRDALLDNRHWRFTSGGNLSDPACRCIEGEDRLDRDHLECLSVRHRCLQRPGLHIATASGTWQQQLPDHEGHGIQAV